MHARLFLLLATTSLLLAASSQAATIAFWQFENDLTDSSGNARHLTPFGNPTYQSAGGVPGSTLALDLDGNDGAIRARGTDSALDLPGSFTVEAFVRWDGNLSQDQMIIFRGDSQAGKDPYYISIRENPSSPGQSQLLFQMSYFDTTGAFLGTPYDSDLVGEIVHIAGTFDDATDRMKLFINGVEKVSTTLTKPRVSGIAGNVSVGMLHDGSNTLFFFNDFIDNVRLSDVALEPSEFLPIPEPSTATLVGLALCGLGYCGRKRRRGSHAVPGPGS